MPPKHFLNSENGLAKKKSRKSVTLKTKLEVLQRIENGEKIVQICKSVGLSKSTVQTIRDNKEKIKSHSQLAGSLSSACKLTRQRSDKMEKMETLLSLWIEDNRSHKIATSLKMIQEKAKSIFENFKESSEDETFKASQGWFDRFKKRHNLMNLKMKGECADANVAKEYPHVFKGIVERGGYLPEQVFNVDQTGLFWKRMPDKSGIGKAEKSALGYKTCMERVSLLLGANAAGDFKLKPLLVYLNSENPKTFRRSDVIWRSSKNAWMNENIFSDWFKNHFCCEVKSYLAGKNLSSKVLLLLDKAPFHLVNLSELSDEVEIEYLPKNVAASIQPMDLGAKTAFQACYLRRLFVNQSLGEVPAKRLWKKYDIEDAANIIGESWKELNSTTMNQLWGKVWPECVTTADKEGVSLPEIFQDVVNLASALGFEDLGKDDVVSLINANDQPLSNEELIQLETWQGFKEEPTADNRELSLKDVSKALSHFQRGINILLQSDPDRERSARVARDINSAVNCYKEVENEARHLTKQKALEGDFKT